MGLWMVFMRLQAIATGVEAIAIRFQSSLGVFMHVDAMSVPGSTPPRPLPRRPSPTKRASYPPRVPAWRRKGMFRDRDGVEPKGHSASKPY